jgi:D-alanyl-D-alanine dipeptidase
MISSSSLLFLGLQACQPQVSEPPPVAPTVIAEPALAEPVAEPAAPPPPPDPRGFSSPVPEGMVDVCELAADLRCQIAYHGPDNFTGAPLPGYGAPAAWMLEGPAQALLSVHRALAEQGVGLLVFDAYRPIRGTLAMVAWAERSEQSHLLNGYIARRSGHNHGHTVDLTLYDLASGEPVDMGCPFDTLDERAHTRNAEGEILEHRLTLVDAMKAHGFRNYSKEWWHYSMKLEGTIPRDVPYGCFEAPEGSWEPAAGWDLPGYEPPMGWEPTPCPGPAPGSGVEPSQGDSPAAGGE